MIKTVLKNISLFVVVIVTFITIFVVGIVTKLTIVAMKTQINRSELFKQAWRTAKTLHIDFPKALRYTWRLFKRYSPIVEIEFVKKSTGEITSRIGTALKEDRGAVLFWSLTDNGWRKAICDNILAITPAYVTALSRVAV